jgi:hypothetical protein
MNPYCVWRMRLTIAPEITQRGPFRVKRRNPLAEHMFSALAPTTDMRKLHRNDRFVPFPDSRTAVKAHKLNGMLAASADRSPSPPTHAAESNQSASASVYTNCAGASRVPSTNQRNSSTSQRRYDRSARVSGP